MRAPTSKTAAESETSQAVGPSGPRINHKKQLPLVTPEARRYAVKELARRAGVSEDFFRKWTIEVSPEQTTVSFGSEFISRVHFVNQPGTLSNAIAGGTIPVARASWTHESGDPDLILPFCESQVDSRVPLYRTASNGDLTCRLDVLGSFVFTLSRVEETLCESRDEHGRFPASASLAVSHNFLERPILDEHGLAFRQALFSLLPNWQSASRAFRYKLTHDIDDIGIPFEFRTAVAHTVRRFKPAATLRDILSTHTAINPAELASVRRLATISSSRCLHSSFYWKGSPRGPHDSGYDPTHDKVQRVIHSLRQQGFELGVHPGYETFADRTALASEVEHLRQALRIASPGGRQHYLRWSSATWLDWEACGLSYDSSLGFADHFGFRAGTSFPYRPWCFEQNHELNLIEVPLLLMDCTPVKYMKLPRREGLERLKALVQRIKQTGGVFTVLWHNTPLLEPDYNGWYEPILTLLEGAQHFDVPARGEQLW